VQQVEEPLPAGQGDGRVEPGVHHAGRRATQDGHAQHDAEPGCERVAGDAHRRAQPGHGQQGGHAEALDEGADEHRDQHGSGRAEQQDQAQVTDGNAEGGAHRRPRSAEHAVGQPQDDEAAEGEYVGAPVHCAGSREGRPTLLRHYSM
jgi:hypothetical protein